MYGCRRSFSRSQLGLTKSNADRTDGKKAFTLTPSGRCGQIPAQTGGQRCNQYPPTEQPAKLPKLHIYFSWTVKYRVADFMPRWQMTE